METSKRDIQLDNIRGLLIILVVFGHCLELLRLNNQIANYIYNFIYIFHMPVFIFITGYLSKNLEKGRNNSFRQLFIPFVIFNSIWNIIQVIVSKTSAAPIEAATSFSLFNPGWALWFILALFMWKSFLPDIVKLKHPFWIILFVGSASRLLSEFNVFLSLSRMLVFSPYFVGGYLLSKDNLKEIRTSKLIISGAVIIVGLILSYLFVFNSSFPAEFLWADRPYSSFDLNMIISVILGLVLYVVGFGFAIVFIRLTPHKESSISRIGKHSFPVYIIHTYIVGLVSFALLSLNPTLQIIILFVLSIIISLVLSSNSVNKVFTNFLSTIDRALFRKEIPIIHIDDKLLDETYYKKAESMFFNNDYIKFDTGNVLSENQVKELLNNLLLKQDDDFRNFLISSIIENNLLDISIELKKKLFMINDESIHNCLCFNDDSLDDLCKTSPFLSVHDHLSNK